MLEYLDPFFEGRELIRGCKVGVTKNHRRYFYMIYTKYRRNTVNCSIREESGNRESWNGPLVAMRLDATSATRLVSITSKSHKDIAIQAVAKWVSLATVHTACLRFVAHRYQVHKYYELQNLHLWQAVAVAPDAVGGTGSGRPALVMA